MARTIGEVAASLNSSSRAISRQETAVPITSRDDVAEIFDRWTDRDIPDRLISLTIEGAPILRRSLGANERACLEYRAAALRRTLMGFAAGNRAELLTAISGVLGAFPAMQRHERQTALAIAAGYLTACTGLPPWAIVRACELIRTNQAGLNPAYCPSEPEFVDIAGGLVARYCRRLADVEALLHAKIEPPAESKPTKEEIEAKLGRKVWNANGIPKYHDRRLRGLAAALTGNRTTEDY